MKRSFPSIFPVVLTFLLVSISVLSAVASDTVETGTVTLPASLMYQQGNTSLQPGLLPHYHLNFFARDVRKLPASEPGSRLWKPGKAILQLNHQFGNSNVYDSGTNRGVGIRMRGFIHFPQKGEYTLQALSNDGILFFIGEELIISDPKQHSDQLSVKKSVQVSKAGWYPVRIDYFQRKGTAALQLFWHPPYSNEMTVIPAEAYAHLEHDG